ncbi:MAG: NAD-dependent epimerase/dehydratase family protein [Gammaproteobacteria bacterium]|nr:NAD-dependent epimerase/dehydratase family protein [Gammaproteobacteria bacterium]
MENTHERIVLITGGAGFIGSHLADAALAAGYHTVIMDDLSSGRRQNIPDGSEFYEIDIRSKDASQLIKEKAPTVIYHLAAQMDVRRSTEDPIFDAEVNILGTLNLLSAAVDCNVKQVIFASTGGAIYGDQEYFPAAEDHPTRPLSPYGVSKLTSERYLYYFHREYGLDATCLRYANVYGERQNPHGEAGVVAIFLSCLLSGKQCTINGDGKQTRDYVHVKDVVKANMAALGQSGFRIYNVGTGIETSVVELYSALTKAVDSNRKARHGSAKPGEQKRSSIDSGKLQQELGIDTPTPLSAGLDQTASWFRQELNVT